MGVDMASGTDVSAISLYFYGVHYMLHGKNTTVDDVLNDIINNHSLSKEQIQCVKNILQGLKDSQ